MGPVVRLGVIVTYRVARHDDGSITASDKFLAEMAAYAERWPGPVDVYVATTASNSEVLGASPLPEPEGNLSYFAVAPEDFGFAAIDPLPDVLLTAIDAPLHTVPKLCRNLPVATVIAIEYTFKTRFQQALVERPDVVGRLGGLKWNLGQEARIIGAARNADGLQANGHPAFRHYGRFNKNSMLYLDSRAAESQMPSPDHVAARVATLGAGDRPVRVAFTGRLEARKGPLQTVAVARELRERGVDFSFLVAGDGPQRDELKRAIADAGLVNRFDLAGVLDFDRELMPRIREEVDVFFCPHPQGDPSCTYVETLAGGVPIVGYANEAVVGLAGETVAVTSVPMGNAAAAAAGIAALAADTAELKQRSLAALSFARAHSFERAYDQRVQHFLGVATTAQAPCPR
ncbi:MAG: glycosyltransferase [Acidimicrobiales bacterium]